VKRSARRIGRDIETYGVNCWDAGFLRRAGRSNGNSERIPSQAVPVNGFQRVLQATAPASLFDYRRLKQEAAFDRELDTKLLIYHLDPEPYREDFSPTLGELMLDPWDKAHEADEHMGRRPVRRARPERLRSDQTILSNLNVRAKANDHYKRRRMRPDALGRPTRQNELLRSARSLHASCTGRPGSGYPVI
jgi:hypothetical protein